MQYLKKHITKGVLLTLTEITFYVLSILAIVGIVLFAVKNEMLYALGCLLLLWLSNTIIQSAQQKNLELMLKNYNIDLETKGLEEILDAQNQELIDKATIEQARLHGFSLYGSAGNIFHKKPNTRHVSVTWGDKWVVMRPYKGSKEVYIEFQSPEAMDERILQYGKEEPKS
jgi:hypothetical protein